VAEAKSSSPGGVLRFGVFQINLAARELRKHGVRVRLPGQPFSILSLLLEKPGEVVTREEMRQRLWAADTFVDFEHGLNSAIKKLRAALGDSPDNSRYVETIPRLGYRFIAPVAQVSTAVPSDVPVNADFVEPAVTAERAPKQEFPNPFGLPRPRFRAALVILAIVATGVYFTWSRLHGAARAKDKVAGGPESSKPVSQPLSSAKSVAAHELYLKGIYFWNKRTVAGFEQAIGYFQQATTADPNNAPAFAGLANSYTLLSAYSSASSTLYIPQARAAAKRALELDEHLAEAHAAMALLVQNHDWDWKTSEKEYRRAIELDPNYATAHQWYAEHLMWQGRFAEALKESERAQQLDPLSLIIATDYGAILYFSRQYDRAIEQFQSVLRKDPSFGRAAGLITFAHVEKGMFAQALAGPEKSRHLYGDGPYDWMMLAYIYGREGQLERARSELAKLEKMSQHEQAGPEFMLWAHLGMGNKEEALADLERAYSEHCSLLTTLKVEPGLDPLRSDPRFQDLLRRVGLAQ
jgi:DNA-binding winged helix-turn-helix (wHTH) protein/Tfp pilus assembly protein PilF